MAKVLIMLAVLAGGALWIFGWPDWAGSEAARAGGRTVVLDPSGLRPQVGDDGGGSAEQDAAALDRRAGPPVAGSDGAAAGDAPRGTEVAGQAESADLVGAETAAGSGPASRAGSAGRATLKASRAPGSSPTERAARVADLLSRAAELEAAGDSTGAEKVLREGMTSSTSAMEVARLGFFLAGLSDSPAESRRLLTNALRQGVVRGEEYELASDHLRALNRSTAGSLLGLLKIREYEVQPNDSLWQLCNKTFPRDFGISPEVGLVQLINGMAGTGLRVGQKLAIPTESLSIEVDRRDHGLVAYLGDVALVAYRVGLGKEGRTPSGTFVVEVKLTEPTWYRGDGKAIPFGNPENILGTRWMGFENNPGAMGYGIHGTAHPESIGSDESMGCVRMRNEEVEELFELVARGTTVSIP